jgi:uncharacterized protein YggU (UPF0235/DUF167 family)
MIYIKAVVSTQMKKDSITEKSTDHFIITVKEKAERNMANKKVIELLASYFNVSNSKIRIINGHRHSHKLLVVDN